MFLFSSRKYVKFEKCYILLISNLKPTNNFKELMNQVIQIALKYLNISRLISMYGKTQYGKNKIFRINFNHDCITALLILIYNFELDHHP